MKDQYSLISRHAKWMPDNALSLMKLANDKASELLFDQGSLTSALVNLSDNNFEVNVLSQTIAVPYWHEQKKLNRSLSHAALIREVELQLHGQAAVFARTIIPLSMKGDRLRHLGKTPLGHLLFKDGRIRVSKREFCIANVEGKNTVGRRTPYEYQGQTILVSEYFLPALNLFLS